MYGYIWRIFAIWERGFRARSESMGNTNKGQQLPEEGTGVEFKGDLSLDEKSPGGVVVPEYPR
jgi:hypothetical protein